MTDELERIEVYLKATGSTGARLSEAATGSKNCISQMRQGRTVAAKHYRAILRYMVNHPKGPPAGRPMGRQPGTKYPNGYRTHGGGRRGGRRRINDVDGAGGSTSMNGSTKIPVPGPSQLHPDLFDAIKSEAFKRGWTVVRMLENIVMLGWQQYQQTGVSR